MGSYPQYNQILMFFMVQVFVLTMLAQLAGWCLSKHQWAGYVVLTAGLLVGTWQLAQFIWQLILHTV